MYVKTRNRKHWSAEELELLDKMAHSMKYTYDEIAKKIGRGYGTVKNKMIELGLPYSNPKAFKPCLPMDKMPNKATGKLLHADGTKVRYEDANIAPEPSYRANISAAGAWAL
jgi:hypothetical protein